MSIGTLPSCLRIAARSCAVRVMLAIAIVLTLPVTVHADPKAEAQKHLQDAATAYKEKRWQDVLDALNRAYAIDPKPELHFSIGQVYVKMGRCPDAIVSYEQFIASNPRGGNADMAKEAIAACKAAAIVQPEPGPVEPAPVEPAPVEPPPPPPPPPSDSGHWYQDTVGVALVGGGTLMVLAGVITYTLARGKLGDAEAAPSYDEQVDLYDRARGERNIAVMFTVVGLAVGGAGAWWYLKKRPAERRIGFAPAQGGGLVTWSGGF